MKLNALAALYISIFFAVSLAATTVDDTLRSVSGDNLKYQVLLQDYIGKYVRITDIEGKERRGRLVAVDAVEICLDYKKKMIRIPVVRVKKIEIQKSVPGEIAKAVGGTFLGIGIFWGTMVVWALIAYAI